jgi:hypothetical protein
VTVIYEYLKKNKKKNKTVWLKFKGFKMVKYCIISEPDNIHLINGEIKQVFKILIRTKSQNVNMCVLFDVINKQI